jgi:putative peptidoglycan lipid II flippase
MTWRTIGASVYHINLIVITAIASTLTLGSITVLNFASNISQFATGIVGVSFATAAFPTLSRAFANGVREEFLKNFSSTFKRILFWVVPASALIFLLRVQIVKIILGAGRFGFSEIELTAAALGLFCFGIFAFALIPLLLRAFLRSRTLKRQLSLA